MEPEMKIRHKEMMSILYDCQQKNPDSHLNKIRQGLMIDRNGKPYDAALYKKWTEIAQAMPQSDIAELTVCFLECLMTQDNLPLQSAIMSVKSLSDDAIAKLRAVKLNYWNYSDIIIECDYKKMLHILEYGYGLTHDQELGSLLGGWSIGIFQDGLPADLADYEIWLECTEAIQDNDVVAKTICFLESFSAEFGFELQPTIAFVKSLSKEKIDELTM